MNSSRLILRSNLGWNINDNHGAGGTTGYETYSPYIEIQWQRRWSEPGQFTIYMPYSADAFNRAVLATLEGRDETGIITKRQIESTEAGTYLTLSGYFAEGVLKWGRRAREFTLTASNSRKAIGRFIAENLTSKASNNRSDYGSTSGTGDGKGPLTEEGKTRLTARTETVYYPILMHTEVGNIIGETSFPNYGDDIEYDTKSDPCDWLYSVLPSNWSLRTYVYTRGDYDPNGTPLIPSAIYSGGYNRADLINIDPATTPAFTVAFKFLKGIDRSLVFSVANKNVAKVGLTIDETGSRSLSRGHVDSDVGWWDSTYPVHRGMMFQGDDGNYKYRGERVFANLHAAPGYDSADYGGNWKFGKMYPNADLDASITKEINAENKRSIWRELESQTKLGILNHWREETVEFEPLQVTGYEYLTNYDLGDQVIIEIENGTQYTARITEIDEVHASNQAKITVRTGTPRRINKKK